jgi:hypothetical protein
VTALGDDLVGRLTSPVVGMKLVPPFWCRGPAQLRRALGLEADLQRRLAEPRLDLDAVRKLLPQWAAHVRAQILTADSDGFDLMLRALDLRVRASRDEIEIEGTAPVDQALLVTTGRTSA